MIPASFIGRFFVHASSFLRSFGYQYEQEQIKGGFLMLINTKDPDEMSAEERMQEIAAILARAILKKI